MGDVRPSQDVARRCTLLRVVVGFGAFLGSHSQALRAGRRVPSRARARGGSGDLAHRRPTTHGCLAVIRRRPRAAARRSGTVVRSPCTRATGCAHARPESSVSQHRSSGTGTERTARRARRRRTGPSCSASVGPRRRRQPPGLELGRRELPRPEPLAAVLAAVVARATALAASEGLLRAAERTGERDERHDGDDLAVVVAASAPQSLRCARRPPSPPASR